jgi:hypothetical protein
MLSELSLRYLAALAVLIVKKYRGQRPNRKGFCLAPPGLKFVDLIC